MKRALRVTCAAGLGRAHHPAAIGLSPSQPCSRLSTRPPKSTKLRPDRSMLGGTPRRSRNRIRAGPRCSARRGPRPGATPRGTTTSLKPRARLARERTGACADLPTCLPFPRVVPASSMPRRWPRQDHLLSKCRSPKAKLVSSLSKAKKVYVLLATLIPLATGLPRNLRA